MGKREYSAGIVSKGFWFLEFKKYLELLKIGNNENEIRKIFEENETYPTNDIIY